MLAASASVAVLASMLTACSSANHGVIATPTSTPAQATSAIAVASSPNPVAQSPTQEAASDVTVDLDRMTSADYTYRVELDISFSDPITDTEDAEPGYAYVKLPVSISSATLTNTTSGHNFTTDTDGIINSSLLAFAVWPASSPLCTSAISQLISMSTPPAVGCAQAIGQLVPSDSVQTPTVDTLTSGQSVGLTATFDPHFEGDRNVDGSLSIPSTEQAAPEISAALKSGQVCLSQSATGSLDQLAAVSCAHIA